MTTVDKNTPETTGGSEPKIQDVESPKRAEDSIIIRNLREEDYPEVRAILQEGMNTPAKLPSRPKPPNGRTSGQRACWN